MAQLTKFRPFAPTLYRDLERLFSDLVPEWVEENGERVSMVWAPRMDVSETEKEYVVHMDLPGIKKEEVTVNFQDGQLIVSGERKEEVKEEEKNYIRMERKYGSFYRSTAFSTKIKEEAIKATFADGVLTVTVPKVEDVKPKKIKIL